MSISDFITRCDRYCEAAGVSQTWLSKRLFADTYRLSHLRKGGTDIGVLRLERATHELADLETARMKAQAA
jgi:hypothetical protein